MLRMRRVWLTYMTDADWDQFDPEAYFEHNYSAVRAHNVRMMRLLSTAAWNLEMGSRRLLDIGTGSNLFPVISMLPYASRIECSDLAASNRRWLKAELRGDGMRWAPYFEEC